MAPIKPDQILRELIAAAFEWQKTKQDLLSVSEKKSKYSEDEMAKFEKALAKVRKRHLQAVKRLDYAVTGFSKIPVAMRKKSTKPVNWKKLLDSMAAATGALSRATDKQGFIGGATKDSTGLPPIDMSKVIDVTED
ncbi:MAG: hypothetical protein ACE5F6_00020 [Anaerolineae bacterium]